MASKRDRKMHQTADTAAATNLTERLRSLRDQLLTGLVERDVAIRLALLATLAGEHLLLIGPPGTAKSLLARRLQLAFKDSTYFERLLTRFTVPEELFGPLSIKALEDDRYERLTNRYLPTASVGFLDEIFKANSAILNALLTLLNEREFDNGTERQKTPLLAVVGASNELPEGEELAALFDRFLLRLHVGPVTSEGFGALLALRGEAKPEIPEGLKLTADDLDQVRVRAVTVEVPEDVVALLSDLRKFCVKEELPVSDRRWRKIVKLLQVSALTNGRDAVSIWDCWLLQHCLWEEPGEREAVYDWYAARVGASAAMDPGRLTTIVTSWEARLHADKTHRSQAQDDEGRPLFRSRSGEPTAASEEIGRAHRGKEPLYLAPPNACTDYYMSNRVTDRSNKNRGFTVRELNELYVSRHEQFEHWSGKSAYLAAEENWLMEEHELRPLMEPTRQKPEYVAARLAEVDSLDRDVEEYEKKLASHVESLKREVEVHLWLLNEFAEPAAASLEATVTSVRVLRQRVKTLHEGLESLPLERRD